MVLKEPNGFWPETVEIVVSAETAVSESTKTADLGLKPQIQVVSTWFRRLILRETKDHLPRKVTPVIIFI